MLREWFSAYSNVQLQHITSASYNTVAITPLKKTPPHFTCPMEEYANLSPAKPNKSTEAPTHSGLTLTSLTNQSSLGFHPLGTRYLTSHSGEQESDESLSNSDSEPDIEVRHPNLDTSGTLLHLNESVQKQGFNQLMEQVQHQQHFAAGVPAGVPDGPKSHRKKWKRSQPDLPAPVSKKNKSSCDNLKKRSPFLDPTWSGNQVVAEESGSGASQTLLVTNNEDQSTVLSGLMVRIPLVDLRVPDITQQQLEKPKATVEPIVRNPAISKTPHRRSTAEMTETDDVQGRDRYPRLLNDEYIGGSYGNRVERSRAPIGGRWERDTTPRDHRSYSTMSRASGRGSDYGRGHAWDREHYQGNAGGEDYWSDAHYESTRESQRGRGYPRHPVERRNDPEYFMQEARRRKKEADKIMVHL